MILTIGREYGSGGHDIGVLLSQKLGIKLYDKDSLRKEAESSDLFEEMQMFYDEVPINSLLYSIVENSGSESIGRIPFAHIREIARREPCIIIGRCATQILKAEPELISIFIHASMDKRIEKIAADNGVSSEKAAKMIEKEDRNRENFYYHYTGKHWRDLDGYQLSLDSGKLGAAQTVEMILDYIRRVL